MSQVVNGQQMTDYSQPRYPPKPFYHFPGIFILICFPKLADLLKFLSFLKFIALNCLLEFDFFCLLLTTSSLFFSCSSSNSFAMSNSGQITDTAINVFNRALGSSCWRVFRPFGVFTFCSSSSAGTFFSRVMTASASSWGWSVTIVS